MATEKPGNILSRFIFMDSTRWLLRVLDSSAFRDGEVEKWEVMRFVC